MDNDRNICTVLSKNGYRTVFNIGNIFKAMSMDLNIFRKNSLGIQVSIDNDENYVINANIRR